MREGDPGDEAFIITAGQLQRAATSTGRATGAPPPGPGDVFGETAILSRTPRTATVEAIDEVTVKIVTRALIEERLGRNTWLGRFVLALADRFREVDEQLEPARTARGGALRGSARWTLRRTAPRRGSG